MKKNVFYLFALVFALCLGACKDDDGDDVIPNVDYAPEVAAAYHGGLEIKVDGTTVSRPEDTPTDIAIAVEGKNKVKMTLKDFQFGTMTLNIEVPDITLSAEGNNIIFQETKTTLNHEMLKTLDVTLNGTLYSTGKINLIIDVVAVDMKQNIQVVFDGEKLGQDYAAVIAGTYVGELNFQKLSDNTAEVAAYTQSFAIERVGHNQVNLLTNNIRKTMTLKNLSVVSSVKSKSDAGMFVLNMTGNTDTIVNAGTDNEAICVIETAYLQANKIVLTLRVSEKGNSSSGAYFNQYRISTTATRVEKLNEAFITGIEWTDPEGIIVGEPVISQKLTGLKADEGEHYGKVEYSGTLSFKVLPGSTNEQLNQLVAKLLTTNEATYKIQTIDLFTAEIYEGFKFDVSYPIITATVVSKDGLSYTAYNITKEEAAVLNDTKTYNFNSWETTDQSNDPQMNYQYPMDWTTSNPGIYTAKSFGMYSKDKPYPVVKGSAEESAGETGGCAKLVTILTNENTTGVLPPKVTAGTLFLGSFETDLGNVLASTKFGSICTKKVVSVSGKYKYTPGKTFWNNFEEDKTGKKDECSMAAILYEVANYNETLDGTNIYTSDKIIAIAQQTSGEKTEYTDFTLTLDYKKAYDPAKKYKLAVIFSSSKEGDKYYGAAGSTMWVDDVTLTME